MYKHGKHNRHSHNQPAKRTTSTTLSTLATQLHSTTFTHTNTSLSSSNILNGPAQALLSYPVPTLLYPFSPTISTAFLRRRTTRPSTSKLYSRLFVSLLFQNTFHYSGDSKGAGRHLYHPHATDSVPII